jgi:hypothetical protein
MGMQGLTLPIAVSLFSVCHPGLFLVGVYGNDIVIFVRTVSHHHHCLIVVAVGWLPLAAGYYLPP